MKRVFTLLAGLVLCVSPLVLAQPEEAPLGIFTHAATLTDGFAFPEDQSYSNGAYTIIASGNDVWNNSDGAYYACKEISGSFVVTADFEWNRMVQPEQDFTAGNEWMKMGIMFRAEADNAASQHAYAILRRDYGTDLQWRDTAGGSSGDSGLIAKGATELNTIRLQRSGNTFVAYRKQADGTFKQIGSHTNDTMPMKGWIGICVTSHDANQIVSAKITNIEIEQIAVGVSVARTLSDSMIDAGDSINVNLGLTIEAGKSTDVSVTEIVPAGFTASNVNATVGTATLNGNIITWTVPNASGADAKLTYAAKSGTATGAFTFAGSALAGGKTFDTTGNMNVSALPKAGTNYGLFDGHNDLALDDASLGAEGDFRYDAVSKTYYVLGSGADIWNAADAFHFVYKEVPANQDAYLRAQVKLNHITSANGWAKVGLMVRDANDPASAMGFSMIRSDGRDFAPQWRLGYNIGADWTDTLLVYGGTGEGQQSGLIEIDKVGKKVSYVYYDAATGARVEKHALETIVFDNPDGKYYIGLAVTSHDAGLIAMGTFENVALSIGSPLEPPVAVSEWSLY